VGAVSRLHTAELVDVAEEGRNDEHLPPAADSQDPMILYLHGQAHVDLRLFQFTVCILRSLQYTCAYYRDSRSTKFISVYLKRMKKTTPIKKIEKVILFL
jgi:hypothetical protein